MRGIQVVKSHGDVRVRLVQDVEGEVLVYNLITEITPNTGSYLWQVPQGLRGKIKLRISDFHAPWVFDVSDELVEVSSDNHN